MPTISAAERKARYDAIDALMQELLRAIRRSITTEVNLDKAGRFADSDKLQADRHKMEQHYRALRKVRSTRTDATQTIKEAAKTINKAAAGVDIERANLEKLVKALNAASKILGIVSSVLLLI